MPGARMTVEQRELLGVLLGRRLPELEIAGAVGVSVRTVRRAKVRLDVMTRPADMPVYDTRYLNCDERREIARLREAGCSMRETAGRLGRSVSTISRELSRNVHPGTGCYLPCRADTQARQRQRRPKKSKLSSHPALRGWVQDKLDQDWSPEQVSGRLRVEFPDDETMRISHESIYQSLYVYPRGELSRELKACLRSGRTARRPRGRRVNKHNRISGMASIHDRPDDVEGRLVPGHHEGDLIMGSLKSNSAVGTIVERTSGLLTLLHLPDGHDAASVADAIVEQMSTLPVGLAKTLTWDRGSELARHADITARTGIDVYFADPYHPWQRGSNENINGLLRQYLPKGTDLSTATRADLDAIANALNDRPRKRHGYLTPNEVFANLVKENLNTVATTP